MRWQPCVSGGIIAKHQQLAAWHRWRKRISASAAKRSQHRRRKIGGANINGIARGKQWQHRRLSWRGSGSKEKASRRKINMAAARMAASAAAAAASAMASAGGISGGVWRGGAKASNGEAKWRNNVMA